MPNTKVITIFFPFGQKSLEKLRRPFNPDHVLDYWRTGKEMIREEMPKFHLRPDGKVIGAGITKPAQKRERFKTPFSKIF